MEDQNLPDPYFSVGEMFANSGTVFAANAQEREYERKFRVVVIDKIDSIIACLCPLLPRPWSFYEFTDPDTGYYSYDSQALATNITAKLEKEDDWACWVVTYKYTTKLPDGGVPEDGGTNGSGGNNFPNESGSQNNPEMETPDESIEYEDFMVAPETDLAGKPYKNWAGQAFKPAVQAPKSIMVYSLSRNENGNYPDWIKLRDWAYSLNDIPFMGFPQGFVQLRPVVARSDYRGPTRFWKLSYQFRFFYGNPLNSVWEWKFENFDGTPSAIPILHSTIPTWQPMFLNCGLMAWDKIKGDPNRRLINVLEPNKTKAVSEPVILNGYGQESTDIDPDTGLKVPNYRTFWEYPYYDFNEIINNRNFAIIP